MINFDQELSKIRTGPAAVKPIPRIDFGAELKKPVKPKTINFDSELSPVKKPDVLTPLGRKVVDVGGRVAGALDKPTRPFRAAASGLFRALRVPQQALVIGPALAMQTGDVNQVWKAVKLDKSFREVAENAGMTGVPAFAAGLAGDILLDPLWIFSPMKLAEAAKIPEMLRVAAESRPAQWFSKTPAAKHLGKLLVEDYGKPKAYVDLEEKLRADVTRAVGSAGEVVDDVLKRFSPDEQAAVVSYMRAGSNPGARKAVLAGASRKGLDAEKIGRTGEELISREFAIVKEMTDSGIMKPDFLDKWRMKYLNREYLRAPSPVKWLEELGKKDPEAAAALEAKMKIRTGFRGVQYPVRDRLQILKGRKDIPAWAMTDILTTLEMKEPSLAVGAIGATQAAAQKAVAVHKFMAEVAAKFGSATELPGYVKLADALSLGPLKGLYVPEAVAYDVNRIALKPEGWHRSMKLAVGWWKHMKISMNPATQARNLISNVILADWAGLQPWKINRYVQAFKALRDKGNFRMMIGGKDVSPWEEARAAGTFLWDTAIGSDVTSHFEQVSRDIKGLERGLSGAAKVLKAPGQLYTLEEQMFKMAVYIEKRMAGKAPVDAVKAAEEALFNYRKVPQYIDYLRSYGIVPFATFPYKAAKFTAKTVYRAPATISKYGKIVRAIEPADAEQHRTLMPDFYKDSVELPWKDPRGYRMFVNINYLLPFSDLPEMAGLAGVFGRKGNRPGVFSSPYADLALAVIYGVDPGTMDFKEPKRLKTANDWAAYLWNFVAPSIAARGGKELFYSSWKGQPTDPLSMQVARTPAQSALANVLGIRIRPTDLAMEKFKRVKDLSFEMDDIQREMKRIAQSPYLDKDEKKQQMGEQLDKIKEVIKSIQVISQVPVPPAIGMPGAR